jgi:acetylornithine/N-succinyldiaminopimelate aminotransferase
LSATGTGAAPSSILPVYARADLTFARGDGAWLITTDGRRVLDFGGGIAVNALGHAHPHLVAALTDQAAKVWHISNLYQNPEGERLARRLTDATFADVVFFTNSGAEALEAAIKMARKYHSANGQPERFRIVTFEAHSTGARSPPSRPAGRRSTWRGLARRSTASTRCRSMMTTP